MFQCKKEPRSANFPSATHSYPRPCKIPDHLKSIVADCGIILIWFFSRLMYSSFMLVQLQSFLNFSSCGWQVKPSRRYWNSGRLFRASLESRVLCQGSFKAVGCIFLQVFTFEWVLHERNFSLCFVFRFLWLWFCLPWSLLFGICFLAFVVVVDRIFLFSLALSIILLYFELKFLLLIIN